MRSRASKNFLIKRHRIVDRNTFQLQMSKLIIANCVHLKKEHRTQFNEPNPVFRDFALSCCSRREMDNAEEVENVEDEGIRNVQSSSCD